MTRTPATIELASTLAVQAALDPDLLQTFTDLTGHPVTVVFEPTTVLIARIAAGYRPDVLIATSGALRSLAEAEHVLVDSVVPLVRSGIGLGVLHSAPHPDISTVDALVHALTTARSVAYSQAGQSGIHFRTLLQRLGIAEQVAATATLLDAGFTGRALLDGRADLAVQQVSELRFIDGVDVIGFLPAAVQLHTEFSAGLGTDQGHIPAARDLLAFLTADPARIAYTGSGLQVLTGSPVPLTGGTA